MSEEKRRGGEERRGESEVYSREMSQFCKIYTRMSTCLCVCVHVGGCLKSFFHIGPLASAITQLYFPSVYNFFKERHSKGRTSTRSERHRKKDRKQNLARKIPPFVEQFKYDSHIKEVDNKKWLDCV